MTPNLVFDVSRDAWNLGSYGSLLAVTIAAWFAALGVAAIDRKRLKRFPARWQVFVLVACAPTALFGYRWLHYRDAASALENGRCFVVDGVTQSYSLRQEGKKYVESFHVGEVPFRYSWHEGHLGFRTTRREGGPMEAGLHVRIHYLPDFERPGSNEILRLEVYP